MADNIGNSPLLGSIIYANNKELAELLIQHGANVDQTDKQGHSPLYWAAYSRHESLIQLLLAHRATVDQADKNGITPLWNAVFYGDKNIVELLLANGADPDQKPTNDLAPRALAQTKNHPGIKGLFNL